MSHPPQLSPPPRPEQPGSRRGSSRRAGLLAFFQRAGPALVSVALFSVALLTLRHELHHVRLEEVGREVRNQPSARLLLGLLLTAASYGVLTLYDLLGLAYLARPLGYPRTALASFVGYSFSNTVGNALLVGTSARYRLYSQWGLSALDVTKLVAFASGTSWLGYCAVAGVVFLAEPLTVPASLHLPFGTTWGVGWLLAAVPLVYLVATFAERRSWTLRGWEIELPRPAIALAQVVIAVVDWSLAGSVLYVLLPSGVATSWPAFLGIFLLAQVAGVASQVPGGLGVFETVFLLLLGPATTPAVAGSLVLFRVVYYWLPLLSAILLLAIRELAERRHGLLRTGRALARSLPAMAPPALAIGALVAGAVLLASGATPALAPRLALLHGNVPLPVVEISHFVASLAGVGLLLLARGLERRLDAAWLLAAVLLAVGAVASLLKGLDFEEAAVLLVLLAGLLPVRRHFYRQAALLAEPFTPGWIAAIALVLLGSTWLGLFAHKHLEYSGELWWRFALHGDAPRFLRATVGVLVVVVLFALAHLLRPVPSEPRLPDEAELARATPIVRATRATSAHLALLGDKHLLWHESGKGFVMYAVEGRSWIAMGNPLGDETVRHELAWEFRERVDREGGWTLFYQVRPENLHLYLDQGLSLLKLGEEARLPLGELTLEGGGKKKLRHATRKVEEEGCTFEVVPPERVPDLLPQLAGISDDWLAGRRSREKGFSLGFFSAPYLARCPLALVRQDGAPVAFANLWLGGGGEELSFDLMRHLAAAPSGVMDFLFVHLALWGREQGYSWLNLGMAPLSGLADRRLAPLWSRLGALAFRHGEHFYHFQGLRQYKEKFSPVWEPRYLAAPGGLVLPRALTNLATLIGGGLRGVIAK